LQNQLCIGRQLHWHTCFANAEPGVHHQMHVIRRLELDQATGESESEIDVVSG
jgi:hypothetical protein